MKAKRVYNNNVVLVEDLQGKEIIVMGRGIGYGLSKGEYIAEHQIEKKFLLEDEVNHKFKAVIQDIPSECIMVSEEIIAYIKKHSTKEINDSIYVTLTDHIANIIERIKMGIHFDTALLMNIKSLYKEEYKLGLHALDILRQNFDIEILDSEANFIALHIVNAQSNTEMKQTYTITSVIEQILTIVKDMFHIDLNGDDLAYDRFITHCRFLIQRIVKEEAIQGQHLEDMKKFQPMMDLYKQQYACVTKICNYLKNEYSYDVNEDEQLYLLFHLVKLTH